MNQSGPPATPPSNGPAPDHNPIHLNNVSYQHYQPLNDQPQSPSLPQPQAVTNPQPADPYYFLKEQPARKTFLIPSFDSSFMTKIAFAVGVIVVLLIAVVLFKTVFSHHAPVNMPSLISVVSEQQELSALATTGSQQSQSYQAFAFTVLGSITTDQSKLNALLSANGIKISSGELFTQPDVASELTQAQADSDFDSVYDQVMQKELTTYESYLANAYSVNQSALLKSYLKHDYSDAQLLLTMLNSPDS